MSDTTSHHDLRRAVPVDSRDARAAYDAYRKACRVAWGRETADVCIWRLIVNELSERFPDAAILLTGVGDHLGRVHGPEESLDLG